MDNTKAHDDLYAHLSFDFSNHTTQAVNKNITIRARVLANRYYMDFILNGTTYMQFSTFDSAVNFGQWLYLSVGLYTVGANSRIYTDQVARTPIADSEYITRYGVYNLLNWTDNDGTILASNIKNYPTDDNKYLWG